MCAEGFPIYIYLVTTGQTPDRDQPSDGSQLTTMSVTRVTAEAKKL